MNSRIIQNLTGSPGYPHGGSGGADHPSSGRVFAAGPDLFGRLLAWLSRIDRRRRIDHENAKAIAYLNKLTDSQLRDIGISRPDIERAVRFGRDRV